MRRSYFIFAGTLSFLGASALANGALGAKSEMEAHSQLISREATLMELDQRNATTSNLISRFLHHLQPRQAGRCGADFGGQRCSGTLCCSSYGWCGNAFEHCAEIVGCQPQYGRCGDEPVPEPEPTTSSTPIPSSSTIRSSSTVPSSTVVSTSSTIPPSSTISSPFPSGTLIVSINGQCGNVTTCGGSPFGNCCSEWYFCGNSDAYCGTGCRSAFGSCGGSPPISSSTSAPPPPPTSSTRPISSSTPVSSSTPAPPSSSSRPTPSSSSTPAPPTPTVPVSQDGRCGSGVSCTGSTFGRCCSDYYWCGNQDDYCRVSYGCRPEWGVCGTQLDLLLGAM